LELSINLTASVAFDSVWHFVAASIPEAAFSLQAALKFARLLWK
jgi:hypothetical protein